MPRITPTTPSIPNRYAVSAPGAIIGTIVPASGTSACSSTSATSGFDGSGPWFIEKQFLRGSYTRVPVFTPSAESFSLTKPTVDYKVSYTYMQTFVVAEYSVKQSTDCFDTSSFTQLQTFEWFPASSDAYGISYGDVGPSSLGATGNFQSDNTWIHRRLWASGDSAVTYSVGGMRHFYVSEPTPITPSYHWVDGLSHFGEYDRERWPKYKNTYLDDGQLHSYSEKDYQLPGAYTTNQESPILIANYIDGLGSNVTNKQFYRYNWDSTTKAVPQDVGIAEYDSSRHYWT